MNGNLLLLGLVQGITEFLPVSSSGHLALARMFFGAGEPSLELDLVLHAATLLAVLIYFARDISTLLMEWLYGFFIKNARRWDGWRFGWSVIIGVIITAPIGVLLKEFAERAPRSPLLLACGFGATSLLLISSKFIPERGNEVSVRRGAFVGLIQGIAVMPGLSRSGSTIWAGLIAGLPREEAFRFSFLLSVPTIVGAVIFDARDVGFGNFVYILPDGWIYGAAAAFVSGFVSLALLRRLVVSDKFWIFAIYCALLAIASLCSYLIGI
ncbi:undecaprenyl-diphosphatase [Synergistales bacterium]|nr:undecaprenyl-diphosphatase [Synergistales bacterium]